MSFLVLKPRSSRRGESGQRSVCGVASVMRKREGRAKERAAEAQLGDAPPLFDAEVVRGDAEGVAELCEREGPHRGAGVPAGGIRNAPLAPDGISVATRDRMDAVAGAGDLQLEDATSKLGGEKRVLGSWRRAAL
jgi:hypothetical protein